MTRPARAKRNDVAEPAAQPVADVIQFLPQRYYPDFLVSRLKPFPGNPKTHDLTAITTSIETNGWYGAIIVHAAPTMDDTGPVSVLAGAGRLDALYAKGVARTPVLAVACDDKTARRIVLADNRTSELGGFSLPKLAAFATKDQRAGNLHGTGYTTSDLDALRAELKAGGAARGETTGTYDADSPAHLQAKAVRLDAQRFLRGAITVAAFRDALTTALEVLAHVGTP